MELFDYILIGLYIVGGSSAFLLLFIFICKLILKYSPTSNVSSYIRKHIITDFDN